MECKAIQKRLSAYLDGELDVRLHETVSSHLTGCADCRHVAASLSQVYTLLEQDATTPANPFLWARVQARLSAPNSVRRSGRLQRLLTPVTVVLGLFLGITLGLSISDHVVNQKTDATFSDTVVESSLWSDTNSLAMQYVEAFDIDSSDNGGSHE
jgi:anti-sigma factor RsiW